MKLITGEYKPAGPYGMAIPVTLDIAEIKTIRDGRIELICDGFGNVVASVFFSAVYRVRTKCGKLFCVSEESGKIIK